MGNHYMTHGNTTKGWYGIATWPQCATTNLNLYNGINVFTRQLLDSKGPLTKKNPTTNKVLIEEFVKHSQEYHNPRDDVTQGMSNGDGLAEINAKIDTMDHHIKRLNQMIHVIQVGCDNCSEPRLTKDYDLDENANKKVQVFYSSGDRYDDDYRKPKREWKSYDKYKKYKEKRFRQQGRGWIKWYDDNIMDHYIKRLNQMTHAIQVGCDNCSEPRLKRTMIWMRM